MRLAFPLPLLLVVSGCDPSWKAEGSVVDSSGDPVEGALVAVVCADTPSPIDTKTTTAAGRFEVGGIGSSKALGCSIEITKAGFRKKSAHMTELCFRSAKTRNYDDPCSAKDGKIVLTTEARLR